MSAPYSDRVVGGRLVVIVADDPAPCSACGETAQIDGDEHCPPCAEQIASDEAEISATYRSLDRWLGRVS